jgi:ABC-type glycerol-3-phosphate transport system substrate-binding protein
MKGMYREPLLFYLDKGKHYLRMRNVREPMAVSFINVLSPPYVSAYKDKIAEWRLEGYKETKDVLIKVQAEDSYLKSDPTIRGELGADPLNEPVAQGKFRLNTLGGWRWRRGNEWVMWKFSVPSSGLYRINFKCWQGWSSHVISVRSLKIDGKHPFREMEEILFYYDKHHRIDTLSDEEAQPYLFYLTGGEHILELKVKTGPVREAVLSISEAIRNITALYREVILITGVEPDPNMEWYNLPYLIPELIPRLEEVAENLDKQAEFLAQLVGYRPSAANTLLMAAEQMKSMAEKPQSIPKRLEQISATLASLGYWVLQLQEGPLILDYILISSPEARMPRARSNFLERLVLGWQNFLASFHKKYTAIGSIYEAGAEEKIIEVWIARGREWVDITKEMIEDDFTPTTGIKVNVNIFPAAQMQALLLAMAAGEAPDVACGVMAQLPVEFAIRNGVLNLNELPDYPSVARRFRSGALIPFRYEGLDYALPETQDFNMLFYRTDILEELNIDPPQTWDDLYKILPILEQNGLEFYYGGVAGPQASAGLTPFLFQRQGVYYTSDGLKSALDTPEALAAFREWTDLYTKYKIPVRANFFNRMRSGEIPIGIADYWNYVLFSTAAPELAGRWRMVPIPGTRKSDGTIDRSAGGISQVVIIPSKTKHKNEAWEFAKWWTSAKVQARFGREIEALVGVEARWNTANIEALKMLSWPEDDIENILEQWKWFKEVPIVPGGYLN